MNRRGFITLLGGAAAWPMAASAQKPPMPKVGFLSSATPIGWENYIGGFHRGLQQNGFIEGENVKIEYRWAHNRYEQLPSLAADLMDHRVALIFASGGTRPALAAKSVAGDLPVIFSVGTDPVALGFVASLSRPAGNMTGVALISMTLVPKLLDLMSALAPKAQKLGLLLNAKNPNAELEAEAGREAANSRGLALQVFRAAPESDLGGIFAQAAARDTQALIVSSDPLFNSRRDQIISLASRHATPTIYAWPEFTRGGGLASYGPDLTDQYRLCGAYAGRILKGERPENLPVVQPTRFNFVINLKASNALGLDVPPALLALADEVIE